MIIYRGIFFFNTQKTAEKNNKIKIKITLQLFLMKYFSVDDENIQNKITQIREIEGSGLRAQMKNKLNLKK